MKTRNTHGTYFNSLILMLIFRASVVLVEDYPWQFVSPQLLDRNGQEILYPVEDDRYRWWARKLVSAVDHHRDLAECDQDGLQAFSLNLVRRVKQTMAKEKCCFCLARKEHEANERYANVCEFARE